MKIITDPQFNYLKGLIKKVEGFLVNEKVLSVEVPGYKIRRQTC